jgi:hypothetical protein
MTLSARLAQTDVKVAEVLCYLPWARIYQDSQDIAETLTFAQLIEPLSKPARYNSRSGRSRGH